MKSIHFTGTPHVGYEKCRLVYILVFMWSLLGSYSQAQTPFHWLIGEEELSGVNVYGITQDLRHIYWITTNKGIFSFNGYVFQTYDHPDVKNSSFFNPTIDYEGDIYFNSLSGQIFKISNGVMTLHHEVPDSLLGSYLSFDFLPDNRMVVSSKACYVVSGDSIQMLIPKVEGNYRSARLGRAGDGALVLHAGYEHLVKIGTDEIEDVPFENRAATPFDLLYLNVHQGVPMFNNKGVSILQISDTLDGKLILDEVYNTQGELSRIYFTQNKILIASEKNGYRQVMPGSSKWFEEYFISFIHEDHERNLILGTFGKGLVVIPNTQSVNLTNLDRLHASRIHSDFEGGIFIGTSHGKTYHWDQSSLSEIKVTGDKYVQVLRYFPQTNLLFVDDQVFSRRARQFTTLQKLQIGSIKDVIQVDEKNYACATNNGMVVLQRAGDHLITQKDLPLGRTYAIIYDTISESFLVATTNGLKRTFNDQVEIITYNGNQLLVNDLLRVSNGILIATQKQGILHLSDGNHIESFFFSEKDQNLNNIRKVQHRDSLVFVSTEGGFLILDERGNPLKKVGRSDGLAIKKVQDFVVQGNSIWFLHQKGLQKIELTGVFDEYHMPRINLLIINSGEDILSDKHTQLPFDQNNLTFTVFAPSLRAREDLTYSYRLLPLSDKWSDLPYADNRIEYRSLAPTDYTFEVQLNYKGDPVDESRFVFVVNPPFWRTWWFYLLSVAGIVFVTYLIFQSRLRKQKRRTEELIELNESKLSALQSQMNPHFIFNSLNSIQEYIVLNERKLAATYLGKFADLIRIYLDFSQSKYISIDQEVTALKLYLELEKLRFEEILEYDIQVDPEINLDKSIPSLLIQPYVENALKHGLLHKSKDRKLQIRFKQGSQGVIVCFIEDNGVGRERSAAINRERYPNHRSFATGATSRRLQLINSSLNRKIGTVIEDILDEHGKAAGTRVILSIPVFDV